tara:strand:+ start:5778 stop:7196 length:1419 start_codon:yes stop_codon:yes gene_type:complete
MNTSKEEIIISLFKNNMIKIANEESDYFTLKSGNKTPIYINLRNMCTDTKLLDYICSNLYSSNSKLLSDTWNYDVLCGVPYGGINYAIYLSITFLNNHPYLIKRKEKKKHGLNNIVDGDYEHGTRCILIEDVITTGSSLLETIEELETHGIKIVKVLSIINRGEEGIETIRNKGYKISSLISLNDILRTLSKHQLISIETYNYIINNESKKIDITYTQLTYDERIETVKNRLAKNILKLMYKKQTNLALSLDVTNKDEFLKILHKVAQHICILKTHINIIDDFDKDFILEILKLQETYGFYILEDSKFSDIGNTFKKQLTGGVYKINSWANSITAHSIAGKTLINVYKDINKNKNDKGIIFVAEMSNQGNLITEYYTKDTIKMCEGSDESILGFVTQKKISNDNYLYLTPGVSIEIGTDKLDQQYRTPEEAIIRDNCDIIIVGRTIYDSNNPEAIAIQLKNRGWNSLLKKFK